MKPEDLLVVHAGHVAVDLPAPKHRSVSQESTYSECGMKFKLTRRDGFKENPAWWNVGGTTFHTCAEWWERAHIGLDPMPEPGQWEAIFRDLFEKERDRLRAETGVPYSQWRAAKKGKEDDAWWIENGPDMVDLYITRQEGREWEILMIGQDPCLEFEFLLDVEGVEVKGFIDQARVYRNGDIELKDLKAGANKPDDTFQLGTYSWALAEIGAVDAERGNVWGSYYMARKGEDTPAIKPFMKHPWSELVYRYVTMDRAENAGIYTPRVSSFCVSCGVRAHCPAMQGGIEDNIGYVVPDDTPEEDFPAFELD